MCWSVNEKGNRRWEIVGRREVNECSLLLFLLLSLICVMCNEAKVCVASESAGMDVCIRDIEVGNG